MTTAAPSIPALFEATASRYGDEPAVIDADRTLTYRELLEATRRFASALVASGVDRGDRVSIWAPNCAEWIVSFLGLLEAGAVLVPINTRFKGPEAAHILRRSRAKALITVSGFLGTDYPALLDQAGTDLPDLGVRVVASGPATPGTVGWDDFTGRGDAGAVREVARRRDALGPDDQSDILFTSGTTGIPKGVVMTHGRTMSISGDWVKMAGLRPGDRYLMINPYFHMFGLKAGILASVTAGATLIPEPVFDVERVLRRIESERVTVLPGPPTLYQSILEHPARERFDLSSLRVAVTGAADIPVELIRRVAKELPFSVIVSGYGLTEGGTATGTDPQDDFEAIATTVGRARPGFEIRLVDSRGTDVAPGGSGEVLLRGPSVMSHYLDDPEATEAALSPEGWLRTGDLGSFDAAGRLRIVGRVKDMFIVGGFNAYPAEIENALLRHPDISQAAVIGIPDDRLGEVGMAFVVLKPGGGATAADIVAWSRDQMANYKVPRRVEILPALPLNATGKVQKDALRARFEAGDRPVESAGPTRAQG